MYFASKLAALATFAAALVGASTVTFINKDSTTRTVYFTPNAGLQTLPPVTLSGSATQVVTFPSNWVGNWYSVSAGAPNQPGMLGEVAFGGWGGITYFDVSAIVNPNDHNGVKQMYPVGDSNKVSGCLVFPCNTAYYLPDDVQTVGTSSTDLVCTLGGSGASKRDEAEDDARVGRKFISGGF